MKNFLFFKKLYFGIFIIGIAVLNACNDDKQYDIIGGDVKIYVKTYSDSTNLFTFSVIHTPINTIMADTTAKFPVCCTRASNTDVKVVFTIDTSLVSAYNIKNGTQYSAIPNGIVTLSNGGEITIQKGTTISSDSLTVSMSKNSVAKLVKKSYLIPVRISSLSNEQNAEISTNYNTVYLTINATTLNVVSVNDMVGNLISTTSQWTATLNDPDYSGYYNSSSIFDMNRNGCWYVYPSSSQVSFTVSMDQVYAGITGICITNYYPDSEGDLNAASVSTSTDGITFTDQGSTSLSQASSAQYIKFYSPVTAKYIKLNVTTTIGMMLISEFNVYQQ